MRNALDLTSPHLLKWFFISFADSVLGTCATWRRGPSPLLIPPGKSCGGRKGTPTGRFPAYAEP
jgi:hypothetical protein